MVTITITELLTKSLNYLVSCSIIVSSIVIHIEVSQLILILRGSYNSQEISHILLLQEFLRQILQITLGHVYLGLNSYFLVCAGNLDVVPQLTGFVVYFNSGF